MLSRLRSIFEPDDKRRAREFWTWFVANEKHYRNIAEDGEDERDHRMKVFLDHLKRYHADLFFITGRADENSPYELIITADGIREVFPSAHALVDAAPSIPGWKIIALKPPQTAMLKTKVGDIEFDAASIQFAQLQLPDDAPGLGISIFYQDYTEETAQVYKVASYLLLDGLLGEQSTTLDLAYVSIEAYPPDIPQNALRPLTDLPRLVAAHKEK